MRSFLLVPVSILLVSLVACNPEGTLPAPILTTEKTQPQATTIPTMTSNAIIANVQENFTAMPASPADIATEPYDEGKEMPVAITEPLTITVIYDNNPYDERLSTAWGFSALVEYCDHVLLFDTGGDGQVLIENLRILGIDPARIDSIMLSHAHQDHTGGLTSLLNTGIDPLVYMLSSFPVSFKRQINRLSQVNEVSPGQYVAEGLWTTGEMGTTTPEQALVIQTGQGLVVVTGCAHPGIVAIVQRARDMFSESVRLVLGGFHLGSKSAAEIDAILKDFERLEVEQVAPCHCTGERAITMFAAEYGEDFLQAGAGSVIRLETVLIK